MEKTGNIEKIERLERVLYNKVIERAESSGLNGNEIWNKYRNCEAHKNIPHNDPGLLREKYIRTFAFCEQEINDKLCSQNYEQ